MIRVKKLNKYFNKGKNNELHVLNDINLEFENNGLVVILGESGSGKTTLLNTIGGLDVFADGEIDYDGETVNRYSPKKIEKIRNDKFGYIFQNYYLLMDNSVEYNVKLALSVYDMTDEEKQERTEYVLDALNMGRYKKKLVSELSGGQQQRVSIARALVKAPSIILADEPTGNLDEENTINTMSLLRNISKECLVIVVSHEKRISKFFADRIIEIQDGQVKKDYKNKATKSYEKADDSNIYLRELSKESMENDDFRINIYKDSRQIKGNADKENSKIISGENISEKIKTVAAQDKENQGNEIKNETDKIVLNFAWKDGKLYIQNLSDTEIAFEGEESGCQMVDDKKPQIDISSVDEIDYSLEKPKAGRTAKLPFREIVKMARENLKLLGKKQAFMIGTLLMVFRVYNKLYGINKLPFVEDIDVKYESHDTVVLHIYDKKISGCIKYMGQYVYFDKDGIVLQSLSEHKKDVPMVTGIKFGKFSIGKAFSVKDEKLFSKIMNISQLISHYKINVSRIHSSSDGIMLYSGKVRVFLGKKDMYDDELAALSDVLKTTAKRNLKGSIDMSDYHSGDKIILKTNN